MAQYVSGEIAHHLFKVRINGTPASVGQMSAMAGAVYVDGVLSGGTAVTITSLGSGTWRVQFTVPSGNVGADLALVVDMTVAGVGKTVAYHGQITDRVTNASIRNYLQSNPITVHLSEATIDDIVSQVSTGGVAAADIAYEVLKLGVTEVIAEAGPIDRHSLAATVLLATNADTTSVPGYLVARHPETEVALFQYQITTGAGCPIQSVS